MTPVDAVKTVIVVVVVLFPSCAARNVPKGFIYNPDNDALPEGNVENQGSGERSKECNLPLYDTPRVSKYVPPRNLKLFRNYGNNLANAARNGNPFVDGSERLNGLEDDRYNDISQVPERKNEPGIKYELVDVEQERKTQSRAPGRPKNDEQFAYIPRIPKGIGEFEEHKALRENESAPVFEKLKEPEDEQFIGDPRSPLVIINEIYRKLRVYEPFYLDNFTVQLTPENKFDYRVFRVHLDNGWIFGLSKFNTTDYAAERFSSNSLELWLKWKGLHVRYTVTVDQRGKRDSGVMDAYMPVLRMYVHKPDSEPARIEMTEADDPMSDVSDINLPSDVVERTYRAAKNHIKNVVNNKVRNILLRSVKEALRDDMDENLLDNQ